LISGLPLRPATGEGGAVKLLLVDGYYYAYRSFHALPELLSPEGAPTGAVFGFLKALRRMVKDLKPDRAAVVWDQGLPKRRTDLQPAYKAQRAEMPEPLQAQLGLLREMITLSGFASVALPDTEADDLMASYAVAVVAMGWECVLATADKDLFQIVDPNIRVYSTNKTDLASPQDTFALLGAEQVLQKWGVQPGQLGDVLCLVGDSSDNIPGVAGIGPKSAAALIGRWGALEHVYANLPAVGSDKLAAKLEAGRSQVFENREMVRLDNDLPLPVPPADLRIEPQFDRLIPALERCGFKSLREEMIRERDKSVSPLQGDLFA
jgi:DNA polymerase-1